MTAALAVIFIMPSSLEPMRNIQKVVSFLTSQFFYLIIGVPLIGPRSYCTHFCLIGYEVKSLIKIKKAFSSAK